MRTFLQINDSIFDISSLNFHSILESTLIKTLTIRLKEKTPSTYATILTLLETGDAQISYCLEGDSPSSIEYKNCVITMNFEEQSYDDSGQFVTVLTFTLK